jgi:hypothetical protein
MKRRAGLAVKDPKDVADIAVRIIKDLSLAGHPYKMVTSLHESGQVEASRPRLLSARHTSHAGAIGLAVLRCLRKNVNFTKYAFFFCITSTTCVLLRQSMRTRDTAWLVCIASIESYRATIESRIDDRLSSAGPIPYTSKCIPQPVLNL